MVMKESLLIAVDFDGTVVDDAYPKIGSPKIFAFETLKRLEQDGHRLILWTYRSGRKLEEAVAFCKDNGIDFYAVNNSYPEEVFDGKVSRKINADYFIDDRNIGAFIGWGGVYQLLTNESPQVTLKKKKGLFSFLKK